MTSLVEIIEKKAKNEPLTDENIATFVNAVAMKTIEEAQIGKIKKNHSSMVFLFIRNVMVVRLYYRSIPYGCSTQ